MCGIAGIASTLPVPDPDALVRMRDTLRHRGPDDAGEWWSADRRIGLATRRLAVIDLSPAGHQPLADSTGRLAITFNGEIYNYLDLRRELEGRGHRFQSATDTEVVLEAYRAWGSECLVRLDGMFAFALYDRGAGKVLFARDRAGEKPLYYLHLAGTLTFASELKALMAAPALPRRLDLRAFEHYLAYGYVPGDQCILESVEKLGPAQAMTYDVGSDQLRRWRYWELPEPPTGPSLPEPELEQRLEDLLLASVRRRMVADVPLGIFLSGGIDSSLVTAMAARASSKPVKTFTVTFPGRPSHDEGPYASRVARHFGTEHTELAAEEATVELLPRLAEQFDEPLADSSLLPTYLVSRLVRQHATVALSGDGGDELFAGYPQYGWIQTLERVRALVPRPLRVLVGGMASHLLPVGFRGRNHLTAFAGDDARTLSHLNLHFDRQARQSLLARGLRQRALEVPPEDDRARSCSGSGSLLQKATRLDFRAYLPDDLLVKVDRASMLASLEVRAPWLDHHLIEFAFGAVPDGMRATTRERKILPRRLARRLLPSDLDLHRKQGFSIPLDAWLRDGGGFFASVLEEADSRIFDRRAIRSLLAGQRHGLANSTRLFSLTLFELWRRHYNVGLP